MARQGARTARRLYPEAGSPTALGLLPLSCEDSDFFPIKYFMTQRVLMKGFLSLRGWRRGVAAT